jgi:uncharacterized protein YcfL
MKQAVITFLTATSILIVGCDSGMTIRQAKAKTGRFADTPIAIQVKTSHPLVVETSYARSGSRISQRQLFTVIKVELAAGTVALENKPRRSGSYAVLVEPQETHVVDVWFDLNDS